MCIVSEQWKGEILHCVLRRLLCYTFSFLLFSYFFPHPPDFVVSWLTNLKPICNCWGTKVNFCCENFWSGMTQLCIVFAFRDILVPLNHCCPLSSADTLKWLKMGYLVHSFYDSWYPIMICLYTVRSGCNCNLPDCSLFSVGRDQRLKEYFVIPLF